MLPSLTAKPIVLTPPPVSFTNNYAQAASVTRTIFREKALMHQIAAYLNPFSLFQFTQVNREMYHLRHREVTEKTKFAFDKGLVSSLTIRELPAPHTLLAHRLVDQQIVPFPLYLEVLTLDMSCRMKIEPLESSTVPTPWSWTQWIGDHAATFTQLTKLRIKGAEQEDLGAILEGFNQLAHLGQPTHLCELELIDFSGIFPNTPLPESLLRLSIQSQNSMVIPENLLSNLKKLQVFKLDTKKELELPHKLFEYNIQLMTFILVAHAIDPLPDRLLAPLIALERFECYVINPPHSDNPFLPNDLFQCNSQLKYITLHLLSLNHPLPERLFSGLNKLEQCVLNLKHIMGLLLPRQTALFPQMNHSLTQLIITSSIDIIYEKLLENLPSLQHCELYLSKATDLPNNFFQYNPQLKKLKLELRALQHLPEELLSDLPLLEECTLRSDSAVRFPNRFFQHNGQLKKLEIDLNGIQHLPKGILDDLPALEQLSLDTYELKQLSCLTTHPHHPLKQLVLESYKLVTLADNLLDAFSTLEQFTLSTSNLKALPAQFFKHQQQLTALSLWLPRVKFPNGILDKLIQLKECTINGHPDQKSFPTTLFKHTRQLRKLELSSHESFPIGILDALTELEDCTLTAGAVLPDKLFQYNRKLTRVIVHGNFPNFPIGILDGLTALQEFESSIPSLDALSPKLFQDNHQLEKLFMMSRLANEALPPGILDPLGALKQFRLSSYIKTLPADLFRYNRQLTELSFDTCGMSEATHIDAQLLRGLTKLRQVEFLFHGWFTDFPDSLFTSLVQLEKCVMSPTVPKEKLNTLFQHNRYLTHVSFQNVEPYQLPRRQPSMVPVDAPSSAIQTQHNDLRIILPERAYAKRQRNAIQVAPAMPQQAQEKESTVKRQKNHET